MSTPASPREHWNQRFAADGYLFGKEPNRFVAAHAHLLQPGQKLLAIADGEGRNGVWLAERGLEVHAIDFSPNALAKARLLAAERKVTLAIEEADLARWSWPTQHFDAVLAVFIQFAGPSLRETIFAGIKKSLKPGGLLLLHGYRPEQLAYRTGGPPDVEKLYSEELLRASFADMDVLELRSYDETIHEGSGHNGPSALIDLVARKRASAA
ncbi:MAG: SAM-dependent methyltransferase [Alphaproteobacteria bacterium]